MVYAGSERRARGLAYTLLLHLVATTQNTTIMVSYDATGQRTSTMGTSVDISSSKSKGCVTVTSAEVSRLPACRQAMCIVCCSV